MLMHQQRPWALDVPDEILERHQLLQSPSVFRDLLQLHQHVLELVHALWFVVPRGHGCCSASSHRSEGFGPGVVVLRVSW